MASLTAALRHVIPHISPSEEQRQALAVVESLRGRPISEVQEAKKNAVKVVVDFYISQAHTTPLERVTKIIVVAAKIHDPASPNKDDIWAMRQASHLLTKEAQKLCRGSFKEAFNQAKSHYENKLKVHVLCLAGVCTGPGAAFVGFEWNKGGACLILPLVIASLALNPFFKTYAAKIRLLALSELEKNAEAIADDFMCSPLFP